MTLKHRNSSKWARRIIKRGLSLQDDGTRAAISEQLHEHELLKRKMNSMKEGSSSSDDSSDDDDDDILARDEEGVSKLLERAKEKTLDVLEDDEIPKSGVLSLPFMVIIAIFFFSLPPSLPSFWPDLVFIVVRLALDFIGVGSWVEKEKRGS